MYAGAEAQNGTLKRDVLRPNHDIACYGYWERPIRVIIGR